MIDPVTGSLIAGGITAGANTASTALNNRANRRLTREMFDKANAYNTPLQQVKRMKEAGLNPALMYQGSVQNTAQQSTAPKQEAYHIPENLLGDLYQKITSGNLSTATTPAVQVNIDNKQADTALKGQLTENARVLAGKMASETALLNQTYSLNRELFNTNEQYRKEQLKKIESENLELKKKLEYMTPTQQQTLKNLQQSYNESVSRTKKLDNDVWVQENDQKLRDLGINPQGNNMVDTILRLIIQTGAKFLNPSH